MPHDGTELEPEPSADDFGAAEESLARLSTLSHKFDDVFLRNGHGSALLA